MEVKKMNLGQTPTHEASGSRISDFALGAERVSKLKSILEESRRLEFWSPKYQAWRVLLEQYLSSGNYPELTRTELAPLLEKKDWITIPTGPLTNIYRDIMRLRNTSGSELFPDVQYTQIQEFCSVYCQYFVTQRKRLLKEIHSKGVCEDVMNQLLGSGTYRGLMCATILYRHNQPCNYVYTEEVRAAITERLQEWKQIFYTEFCEAQAFLGESVGLYNWYCDTVRDAICRSWDNALISDNRPDFVTAGERLALSKDCADNLHGYISDSPAGIGPSMLGTAAFDAMYQIFYNNDPDSPDNAERAFFALCVPQSTFKTMVDYLYDFYWCVADGLLSSALYARIVVAYQQNKDSTDPDDYRASLVYRGYPELK